MGIKARLRNRQLQRQKDHVKELIGIREIRPFGVLRKEREEELVIFLLEADNLSVLSEAALRRKVYGLMTVLKGITDLELCCVNARENFTENKRYLKKRLGEEKNPAVRNLLLADLAFLETMEEQNTGAREFLLLIRLGKENTRDIINILSRVEKAFREQDIRVKRAEKEDIKRMLAVYFAQQISVEELDDYDGERWVRYDAEVD